MQNQTLIPIGMWRPDRMLPAFSAYDLLNIIPNIREPLHIVQNGKGGHLGLARSGEIVPLQQDDDSLFLLLSTLPAIYPEWLGDRSFQEAHNVRFPYIAGAMFRGIASPEMVIAMAGAGMIGFLGSGGMSLPDLEKSLDKIQHSLGDSGLAWGSNLLHSPTEPELEEEVVDLYLARGVHRVSAAAFMGITPSVVRYSATGLQCDSSGRIHRRNHVFAKLSRPEIARLFMSPPPQDILDNLVSTGSLTETEASLAARIPVAEDITVEADSGGHTDSRPLTAILPTIISMRNKIIKDNNYVAPIRIGAAGGLGAPSAVAAAFSMGAAYVVTGSVNESAIESGLSMEGRKMLAIAGIADVALAPAADMFEYGAKVQVLKRGTMFANRATQLYNVYNTYDSIEAIPSELRSRMEKEIFNNTFDEIWLETRRFFSERNPREIEKGSRDPRYRMALIFRWYLGNSAMWAISGHKDHKIDYQICCGPAIGAFNEWVKGTYLEDCENRTVTDIAFNLLEGAAVITRAQQLRTYGIPVPESAFHYQPRPLC